MPMYIYGTEKLDTDSIKKWSSIAFWLLSEAIFLSMGIKPEKQYSIEGVTLYSEDEKENAANVFSDFRDRQDFILRAILDDQLTVENVSNEYGEIEYLLKPIEFSKWAIRYLQPFPRKLYEAVVKNNYSNTTETYSEIHGSTDSVDVASSLNKNLETKFNNENVEITRSFYDGYVKYEEEIRSLMFKKKKKSAKEEDEEENEVRSKALYFLLKTVGEAGCLCNHSKLAQIVYVYATDENGKKLNACTKNKRELHYFILKMSRLILPSERIFPQGKLIHSPCLIAEHNMFREQRIDSLIMVN